MAAAAAAATATADPPGYFVGKPLHYQEQQPQTVPPLQPEPQPSAAVAAAPAVDDQNAVDSQVPGYYKRRVQQRRGEVTEHNNNTNSNAGAADHQQKREPNFFAKCFGGCFSGGS